MRLGMRLPLGLVPATLMGAAIGAGCLSACSLKIPRLTLEAATALPPTSQIVLLTPTASPTALPDIGYAVIPDSASVTHQTLQGLADLANENGISWQDVTNPDLIDFSRQVRIVVAFSPDPGVQALAAAHPGTQFVAVQIPGLTPGPNLTTIGGDEEQAEVAFIAGFLAEAISSDWRGAIIIDGDDSRSSSQGQFFQNGGGYLCGLCRPAYPPFLQYPLVITYTDQAGPDQVRQQLSASGVHGVYLASAKLAEALAGTLDSKQLILLGSQTPATLPANWGATILIDPLPAIRQIWERVISGNSAGTQPTNIVVADVNPLLVSQGRLDRTESIINDLEGGLIDPGAP
jgi:hypothetical protein